VRSKHNSAVLTPDVLDHPTLEWLADFEYPVQAVVSKPPEPIAPLDSPICCLSAPDADWLSAQEFPTRAIVQAAWYPGPTGEPRAKNASRWRGRSVALATGSHVSSAAVVEETSGLGAFWASLDSYARTGMAGVG
jgi:hypothetical protein